MDYKPMIAPQRSCWREPDLIAFILVALAASLLWPPIAAQASQFYIVQTDTLNDPSALFFEPTCNAHLEGRIEEGDHESIREMVESASAEGLHNTEPGRFPAVCLSSGGGDVGEALRIAGVLQGWM